MTTTKERVEAEIQRKEREIQRLRDMLTAFPKLSELDLDVSICGGYLDFDHLTHAQVITVIKAIGGKWDKEPQGDRVNYMTESGGIKLRCWQGEPPPSCRIVEEEVEIPAQPARKEVRRKLVCVDTQPTPTTPEAA